MDPVSIIRKYTGHDDVVLTPSGDTAIFTSFYISRKMDPSRKNILIPDQAGWLTYRKFPKMLEREPVEVKTDHGLIDLDDLRKKAGDACCFIYTNPAGYFAEQDIKGIYEACKGKCLVIMDVSGSLGDKKMCDGRYADIMVGSFGKWKPVNMEYGGFISAKNKELFEKPKEIFNTIEFDISREEELAGLLSGVGKRYRMFYRTSEKIKKELEGFEIVHKGKKGINVIVKFRDKGEKEKIIKFCRDKGYEYTLCPRYIRVEDDAVSIEVKRLKG